MKRNFKKTISALMIGALLVTILPTTYSIDSVVYADELSEAQEKKEDAQNRKQEAEAKLETLEAEKDDIMKLIEDLDTEICSYESTISELNTKSNNFKAQATIAENNLQMAYIAEAQQYESMKERIQFAYENGDAEYIEALFSIKEYSSVVNQSEYVSQVSAYDQKQLNDLLEIEQTIAEYKETIDSNLAEVESLQAEAEGEQEALQVMQDGKQATLEEYNIQIADTEYTIEELAALEAEQDASIAALEAQAAAARAAAEAAAAAAKQTKQAETASSTDATQQQTNTADNSSSGSSSMPSYGGGAFTWPCPSSTYITSGFGARTSPTEGATSNHMGIDIGCSSGASIVAASDGVVIFTGYYGAGGNAVIVDHGNGLTTCYFHLSGYATSTGAYVTAGQTIAYAGSTGVSTGPHLHFAVRVNGSYVDPMGYL